MSTVPPLFLSHVQAFADDTRDNGALLGALKATAQAFLARIDGDPFMVGDQAQARHAIAGALKAMDAAIAGQQSVQLSPFVFGPTWGSGLPHGVMVNYDYARFVVVQGHHTGDDISPRVDTVPVGAVFIHGTDALDACDRLSEMIGTLNAAIAKREVFALFDDVTLVAPAADVVALLAPGAIRVAPKAYETAWYDSHLRWWIVGWGGVDDDGHPQFTRSATVEEAKELGESSDRMHQEHLAGEGA